MTVQNSVSTNQPGDALDILGSYRRRLVLARVSDREGPVPLAALARDLAARAVDGDEVTETAHDRARIRLHHVDLPPLVAAGLVSYDSQRGLVRSGDLPLSGEEWLEMPVVEALEAWNR